MSFIIYDICVLLKDGVSSNSHKLWQFALSLHAEMHGHIIPGRITLYDQEILRHITRSEFEMSDLLSSAIPFFFHICLFDSEPALRVCETRLRVRAEHDPIVGAKYDLHAYDRSSYRQDLQRGFNYLPSGFR